MRWLSKCELQVWQSNPGWCRALNTTMTYFTLSTYFWMLCEVGLASSPLFTFTFNFPIYFNFYLTLSTYLLMLLEVVLGLFPHFLVYFHFRFNFHLFILLSLSTSLYISYFWVPCEVALSIIPQFSSCTLFARRSMLFISYPVGQIC